MKAINIEWDVDCEEDRELLPTEIGIPKQLVKKTIQNYLMEVKNNVR